MNEIDTIIDQLQRQRTAIDNALQALRGVNGRPAASEQSAAIKKTRGRPKGSGKKRRRISAEARERMAAAQRARWAAQRAGATKKRTTK